MWCVAPMSIRGLTKRCGDILAINNLNLEAIQGENFSGGTAPTGLHSAEYFHRRHESHNTRISMFRVGTWRGRKCASASMARSSGK